VNSSSVVIKTNIASAKRGLLDWALGESLYYHRKTGNNLLDKWEHPLLLKDCKISIYDAFIRAICVFDLYCTTIGCPYGSGCSPHKKVAKLKSSPWLS
jgi:hypothetical protein